MSSTVGDRWRARRARRMRDRGGVAAPSAVELAESYDPAPYDLALTARRLIGLWREQRRLSLLGFAYAFVYSALSLAIPVLVARAIDRSIVTHREPLAPLLALIVVLALVRGGVNFLRRYATSRVGVRVEARLRELLYGAYLRFPRAFYDRQPTGQVLSRATNDLYPVRYFIGWGMVQAIQSAMLIVGTGVLLVETNARLALWSALPLPLIAYAAWLFGRRVAPISRAVQARKGDLTDAANEAVVGIEMVQAFGREEIIQERFAERATAIRDEMIRQARVEAVHLPPVFYLPSLSVAIVLLFGGRAVINGSLTYGQLALFIQLLLQIVWPLEAMGLILDLGQRALASAGRAFAWLEEIPLLPEAPPDGAATVPADAPVSVAFDDVHFSYSGGSEVLRGVRLRVEPDEIVAVCGRTGSGKSTLLSLLARHYDPTAGAVRLDGIDTRSLPLAQLRAAVAIATQRPVLFSETLSANLLAGRSDADEPAMTRALELAGLAGFVDSLPEGLETLIGERGVNLSGGQRQRVALARVLLANAPVVILDDPLSAVDTELEREIVAGLRDGLGGRAVLLATQRLSTLALADRVVVLDGGRVVEEGVPEMLIEHDGPFAELFGEDAFVSAA
ncbi:MAG: ABC transporter ATP-binding protein [Solirubrobacteraceae bacterium]